MLSEGKSGVCEFELLQTKIAKDCEPLNCVVKFKTEYTSTVTL